jgi:hypothetical protein
MNEKPLERLNYFNGQRLQAADLKTEQDYHIRVRRWLNRSLYSSGIAEGLSVYAIKDQARVRVTPGLAIDHLGREIILLDEQIVDVVGTHHDRNGRCDGPYLTIRYREDIVGKQDLSCAVGGHASDRTAWGSPGRILAGAVLELNAELPNEDSGKIPLACLTLTEKCKSIQAVDTGVRRYIGEGSANKVRQYALEGTREVAALPAQPKGHPVYIKGTILFHVRGRQPNSVTLFLKSRRISPLHYTELGSHTHGLTIKGGTGDPIQSLQHHHAGFNMTAENNATSAHTHSFTARRGYIGWNEGTAGVAAVFLIEKNWGVQLGLDAGTGAAADVADFLGNVIGGALNLLPTIAPEKNDATDEDILGPTGGVIGAGSHSHTISGDTENASSDMVHQHSLTGSGTSDPMGAVDTNEDSIVARSGSPLSHFAGLQIAIDGKPQTLQILQQLAGTVADNDAAAWKVLGNGGEGHPIADERKEAVEIKLHFLPGVVLSEGEHSVEFSVDLQPDGTANGGLVQFNLYVE